MHINRQMLIDEWTQIPNSALLWNIDLPNPYINIFVVAIDHKNEQISQHCDFDTLNTKDLQWNCLESNLKCSPLVTPFKILNYRTIINPSTNRISMSK
jgi:hypothetical protein